LQACLDMLIHKARKLDHANKSASREKIGKAHCEFFKYIQSVEYQLEVQALIYPLYLVEIEVEALCINRYTREHLP